MFATNRNAGLAMTRDNDIIDKTGEWGHAADEEGSYGTPIGGVFIRVAVDAMKVVHVGYRYIHAADDVVAVARDKRVSDIDVVDEGGNLRTRS